MRRTDFLAVAWAAVLLVFSTASATAFDLRERTVTFLIEHFDMEWQQAHDWHLAFRKIGHIPIYLVTGLVAGLFLRARGRGALVAFGLVVVAAVLDETIQSFVPGRHGQIVDVLLDAAAGSVGIWISRRVPRAPSPPSTTHGSTPAAV